METEKYQSLSKTAEALNLPRKFLQQLAESKIIPYLKVRNHYKFKVGAVSHALDQLAKGPEE